MRKIITKIQYGDGGSKEEDSVENDPHDPGSDGDGRSKEEDSIENDLQNPGTDGNGKSNEEEYSCRTRTTKSG